jgi:tetratricopeptide (TPR) repeat protein
MRQTINLVEELLRRARRYQDAGSLHDALLALKHLSHLPELSTEVVAEVHSRLADIRLALGHFRKARRHLTLLLALRPDDARVHFRLGCAFDRDTKAEPRFAMRHYRQSLHLDPAQVDCLAAMGQLALRMDRAQEGIVALQRAVELKSDDPTVLAALVDALVQEGEWAAAESAARLARFRGPIDARFQAVWDDFRFAQKVAEQSADSDQASVLPFAGERPVQSVRQMHGLRWRADQSSRPAPHLPRTARRPDPRRAP